MGGMHQVSNEILWAYGQRKQGINEIIYSACRQGTVLSFNQDERNKFIKAFNSLSAHFQHKVFDHLDAKSKKLILDNPKFNVKFETKPEKKLVCHGKLDELKNNVYKKSAEERFPKVPESVKYNPDLYLQWLRKISQDVNKYPEDIRDLAAKKFNRLAKQFQQADQMIAGSAEKHAEIADEGLKKTIVGCTLAAGAVVGLFAAGPAAAALGPHIGTAAKEALLLWGSVQLGISQFGQPMLAPAGAYAGSGGGGIVLNNAMIKLLIMAGIITTAMLQQLNMHMMKGHPQSTSSGPGSHGPPSTTEGTTFKINPKVSEKEALERAEELLDKIPKKFKGDANILKAKEGLARFLRGHDPGRGTRALKNKRGVSFFELRLAGKGGNETRIYFRYTSDGGHELLGYSGKGDQAAMIERISSCLK